MSPPPPPAAPPKKNFPYDHLFKLLMIGDAGVGKVSSTSTRNSPLTLFYLFVNGTFITNDNLLTIPFFHHSPLCYYDLQTIHLTNISNLLSE